MSEKMKAYTVMEMIIVMIVSSIVVSMSYLVFSRTVLFSHKIFVIYNKNYNVVLFDHLLLEDCMSSDRIEKTTLGFDCLYKDKRIIYTYTNTLCRTQFQQVDTLKGFTDIYMQYKYLDSAHTLIKDILVMATYEGDPVKRVYSKQYGSNFLMKMDE